MYVGIPTHSSPKKLLFAEPTKQHYRDPRIRIAKFLNISIEQAKTATQSRSGYPVSYTETTRLQDDDITTFKISQLEKKTLR